MSTLTKTEEIEFKKLSNIRLKNSDNWENRYFWFHRFKDFKADLKRNGYKYDGIEGKKIKSVFFANNAPYGYKIKIKTDSKQTEISFNELVELKYFVKGYNRRVLNAY